MAEVKYVIELQNLFAYDFSELSGFFHYFYDLSVTLLSIKGDILRKS